MTCGSPASGRKQAGAELLPCMQDIAYKEEDFWAYIIHAQKVFAVSLECFPSFELGCYESLFEAYSLQTDLICRSINFPSFNFAAPLFGKFSASYWKPRLHLSMKRWQTYFMRINQRQKPNTAFRSPKYNLCIFLRSGNWATFCFRQKWTTHVIVWMISHDL